MIRWIQLVVLCGFLFSSCFEEDKAVAPYPGIVNAIGHDIGEFQSFFSFKLGEVVSVNPVSAWDLAFDASPGGWHIKLNSGKHLYARYRPAATLTVQYPPLNEGDWHYDSPCGDPLLSAIGLWCDTLAFPFTAVKGVWELAIRDSARYKAFGAIQLVSAGSGGYQLFGLLAEETEAFEIDIPRADSVSFVFYNLKERAIKKVEPARSTYDIVFMPYYAKAELFGITLDMLVRGVLLNPYATEALLVEEYPFESIEQEIASGVSLSSKQDVIGFDWKGVDVDIGAGLASYRIIPGRTYLIRVSDGGLYKMRFLGYALDGRWGFPRFEYRKV